MHILRQIKGTILFITSLEVSCIYNTYDAVVKVFKGLSLFFLSAFICAKPHCHSHHRKTTPFGPKECGVLTEKSM